MPLASSSVPRPPSIGRPVHINRLRHASLPGTSTKSTQLSIDSRPCETTSKHSQSMERLVMVEDSLSSLQAAARSGAAPAVEQKSTSQEQEMSAALINPSNVPLSATLEDSVTYEARSNPITQDGVCSQLDVKTTEPKSTPEAQDQTVLQSRELPRISRTTGSVKVVNRITETMVSEVRRSKSLMLSPRGPERCPLSDAKFAGAMSSAEQPPSTFAKTGRLRNEGSVTLRSLDSRDARMISGLLTSLAHGGGGSRVASTGCYKLVSSSGLNSSSTVTRTSDASSSKTSVSLTHLALTLP